MEKLEEKDDEGYDIKEVGQAYDENIGLIDEIADGKEEKEQIEYRILDPEELFQITELKVTDLQDIILLPKQLIRIMLAKCYWDKDRLIDRWFDDGQALLKELGIDQDKQKMIVGDFDKALPSARGPIVSPPELPSCTSSASSHSSDSGQAGTGSGTSGSGNTAGREQLSKTNLYIHGITQDTTDKDLFNLCIQYGTIASTEVILDENTNKCIGYGFVAFESPVAAEAAVKSLQAQGVRAKMAEVMKIAQTEKVKMDCPICLESVQEADLMGLNLCGHHFCKECLTNYMKLKVEDFGILKYVECPSAGCPALVDYETARNLLDDECLSKFKYIMLKSFVQTTKNYQLCPAAECSKIIYSELMTPNELQCACGTKMCISCLKECHFPVKCLYLDLWNEKLKQNDVLKEVPFNIKECPKCRVSIEKNLGCDHIRCRMCKNDFCWRCGGDWDKHKTKEILCSDLPPLRRASVNANDERTERFNSFYERYLAFEDNMKSTERKTKLIEDNIKDMNVSSNVQDLNTARDVYFEARKRVKYTYIMLYFMRENNQTELLKDNLKRLEYLVENIWHSLTASEKGSNWEFVKTVKEQTLLIKQRMEALVSEIEEGHAENSWEIAFN